MAVFGGDIGAPKVENQRVIRVGCERRDRKEREQGRRNEEEDVSRDHIHPLPMSNPLVN